MRTPASIAGHPIHPMLVPIAIGLWIFSLVGDLFTRAAALSPPGRRSRTTAWEAGSSGIRAF